MKTTSKEFTEEPLFSQNIRTLAHYLYVLRGCQEGHALNNWIEAEKMLRECLFWDQKMI